MKGESRTKEQKALAKFIVSKLLPNLPAKRWPQERKMANKLVDKFPDNEFWETFPVQDNVWTLSWFLKTDLGGSSLNDHSIMYKTKNQEVKNYDFKQDKIGEDFELDKKPKNPLDFF